MISQLFFFKFLIFFFRFAEQKKQKLSDIRAGLDDAEALVTGSLHVSDSTFQSFLSLGIQLDVSIFISQIRKMDLEARSLQPNVKAVLLAKLREYKSDLNNLKSEVKRIASGNLNPTARDELLESGMADTLTVCFGSFTFLLTCCGSITGLFSLHLTFDYL